MVLACDGIWDCLTNQQVATFVRKHIAQDMPLKEICERMMDSCLADQTSPSGVGCDNMTVEIVAFLNGQTEKEWFEKIKASVKESEQETPPHESSNSSNNGEQPEQKKGMIQSESRQYSVNELKNAPDLTLSLEDNENDKNKEDKVIEE